MSYRPSTLPVVLIALCAFAAGPVAGCAEYHEGTPPTMALLAALDAASGELPEGLAIAPDGRSAYVGLMLTGQILAVSLGPRRPTLRG